MIALVAVTAWVGGSFLLIGVWVAAHEVGFRRARRRERKAGVR